MNRADRFRRQELIKATRSIEILISRASGEVREALYRIRARVTDELEELDDVFRRTNKYRTRGYLATSTGADYESEGIAARAASEN